MSTSRYGLQKQLFHRLFFYCFAILRHRCTSIKQNKQEGKAINMNVNNKEYDLGYKFRLMRGWYPNNETLRVSVVFTSHNNRILDITTNYPFGENIPKGAENMAYIDIPKNPYQRLLVDSIVTILEDEGVIKRYIDTYKDYRLAVFDIDKIPVDDFEFETKKHRMNKA